MSDNSRKTHKLAQIVNIIFFINVLINIWISTVLFMREKLFPCPSRTGPFCVSGVMMVPVECEL